MVDRRMVGGWLSGPRSVAEAAGLDLGYPGQRLGLPQEGQHAVAGLGRRLAATFIDWTVAQLIVLGAMPGSTAGERAAPILLVFALINLMLVSTLGSGIGGRVTGLRLARIAGAEPPFLLTVLLRRPWMLLLRPALIWHPAAREQLVHGSSRLNRSAPVLLSTLVRTLLLVLVIPALFLDRDHRGLHDRASNSVVVRR